MWKRIASAAAKLISGRVMLILLGLAGGAAGWAWWATEEMRSCNQELGALGATAGQNERAVIELSRRLSQEVQRRALDLESERRANAALERRLAEIQQQTTDEREERDAIYDTDDECRAWRTALVCADIADRLRERARALSPGPGRGPGAGDTADSGEADRAADDRGSDA